ncbi:MAG: response regulator [Bacteroidales bacterium]|nr:response regulator [Bacteroidales bacterium]
MSYKVLLVDNSPTILEVMTFAFENNGFEITLAESQDKVYDYVKNYKFDLIIIDKTLCDGKIVSEIRKSVKNQNVFVFILSETSDFQTKFDAKSRGVSGWILKPFIPEKLVKTIRSYLAS